MIRSFSLALLLVCVSLGPVRAADKPFDGTTTATLNTTGASLAGVYSGDAVTLVSAGATGTFARVGPANDIVVTITGLSITGAQAGDYTLPKLYTADEAFVTGTMGGLIPVITVDGRSIGDGKPGPVTKQLTALFADLTATTGTPVT